VSRSSRLLLPLALAVVFVLLFDSIVVYPFRLFVVFLHEVGHGTAAVLTGGRIVSIGISPDEGGVCVTRGGIRFVVLNAGYLGSLLFGALFLVLGARRRSAALSASSRSPRRSSMCAPGSASCTRWSPASCC